MTPTQIEATYLAGLTVLFLALLIADYLHERRIDRLEERRAGERP